MSRFTSLMIVMFLAFIPIYAGTFTVVIDAGHGGRDPGCRGKYALEKDVTLSVAKALQRLIEKEYDDDVEVVMTREDDSYVSLQRRADIANDAKADIFISIHINSVGDRHPRRKSLEGSQVYVLSDSKASGKTSSIKKNTRLYASSGKKRYEDNTEEIGYSLALTGTAKLSYEMAGHAMMRLCSTADRADKGIHQAGFQVLWATAMPAVLVELDYMCNPWQEKFLASEKGQAKCARALFEAFGDYYAAHSDKLKKSADKKKNSKKKKNKKQR